MTILAIGIAGISLLLISDSEDRPEATVASPVQTSVFRQAEVCPVKVEVKCEESSADIDGDGFDDKIGTTNECQRSFPTCELSLRVATVDGERLTYAIEGNSARTAGAGDIDGHRGAEIAFFGTSAASSQWGVFLTYRDGKLEPVSHSDGKPFELTIAGSIVNRVGIECRTEGDRRQLVVTGLHLDPPSADSTTFIGSREVFEFGRDGRLVSLGEEQLRLARGADGSDPDEAKIGGLDCPGFKQFA